MVDFLSYPKEVLSENEKKNLQIAEYMEASVEEWYPASKANKMSGLHVAYNPTKPMPNNVRYHCAALLKYDKSFDWLALVIEKIGSNISDKFKYQDFQIACAEFYIQNSPQELRDYLLQLISNKP